MPIYEFTQNNSGGVFSVDDNLCHRVYIEADSIDEANNIALIKGMYFEGVDKGIDCPCCGDRWHRAYDEFDLDILNIPYKVRQYFRGDISKAQDMWYNRYGSYTIIKPPSLESTGHSKRLVGEVIFHTLENYLSYIANCYGQTTPDSRIFYFDKTVEIYRDGTNPQGNIIILAKEI